MPTTAWISTPSAPSELALVCCCVKASHLFVHPAVDRKCANAVAVEDSGQVVRMAHIGAKRDTPANNMDWYVRFQCA